MPNFGRFNQTLFNGGRRGAGSGGITDKVIFNGFGLLNESYITTKLNVWNMPQINLIETSNPKSDGATLLDRFYKQRTIHIEGHIIGTSYEDEQEKIDNLKKAISVKQGYFEFLFGDKYRRILCTLTNQDIIDREHYDIEHAEFSLTFKAEMPFRSEKTRESIVYEQISEEINEDIYNYGSEYSNPIINIVMNSVSNCNSLTVGIGDNILTFDGGTQTTLSSVSYGGESCTMTAGPDNTRTGARPSTGTTITVSLNNGVPACVIGGNQPVQLTESSVEGVRNGNTQGGVGIVITLSITRSGEYQNGDIIDINSENKTVSVNGNATDFNGRFPILKAGGNVLNVKANGTYEFDISVLYKNNYL